MTPTAAIPEAAHVRRKGNSMSRGFGGIAIFGGHSGRDDDDKFRRRRRHGGDDDCHRRTKRHHKKHRKHDCD